VHTIVYYYDIKIFAINPYHTTSDQSISA